MIIGTKNKQFNLIAHYDALSHEGRKELQDDLLKKYPDYFGYSEEMDALYAKDKNFTDDFKVIYYSSQDFTNFILYNVYILMDANRNMYIVDDNLFEILFYTVDDKAELIYHE